MVRQTKRFKKGLNKKVLSAILAASMIMTSSSFAMAAPLADDTLTDETVVTGEVEETEEVDATTYALDEVETNDSRVGSGHELRNVTINQNAVSEDGKVTLRREQPYENGDPVEPTLNVRYDDQLVSSDNYTISWSNNTDSFAVTQEMAKAVITFIGDYNDLPDITVLYQIGQISLSNANVDISSQDGYIYNGQEQYPEISSASVTVGENTYELDSDDYEVVAESGDIVNVGKKSIKIKGKNNFKDEMKVGSTYTIQQAPMAGNVTVSADQVVFGNGKDAIEKAITVTDNFTKEELASDEYAILWYDEESGTYSVYNNPSTDIGVHTFRVTGTAAGNFNDKTYVEGTYEIVKDGTLQMALDNLYKVSGGKIGDFLTNGESAYEFTYDGKDHVVSKDTISEIIVRWGDTGLKENQFTIADYTAEWKNVGEYVVTLEGKNDYAGETATLVFKINPKALNEDADTENTDGNIKVEASQSVHASGAAGDLIVKVFDGDTVLKEGTDYTYEVTTKDDKNYVVITGIGNYTTAINDEVKTLTKVVNDSVKKLHLSDSSITAEVVGTYKYTGNKIEPKETDIKLVEKDGSKEITLKASDFRVTDYKDNTNAGEATVIVEARDNTDYTGTREITFRIEGESFEDTFNLAEMKDFEKDATWNDILSEVKVVYQNGGATYAAGGSNGFNSKRIDIEITKDGKEIDKSKDDVVGGTYTVTVTPSGQYGSGRYEGELTTTFNVIGTDLKTAGAKIADIDDQVYTSKAITPAVVVTVGNKTLEEGKDYTVSYSDNIKGGEATVTVTGINDYSGTIEKNFKITQADQSIRMTVAAQERDLANGSRTTGSNKCTLKLGFGMEDADLNLSYATSDKSVATVDGNGVITYQGVGECTITVTAKATDSCKEATLPITVKVGNPGTPTFTPSVTKNTAKKAFVVTSSTVRGADGFEVQYSIRSDFWRATTKDFSNTGSKLLRQTCKTVHSNRTYYVRVRAYQIVDGEKVYSKDWSPVKTVKTK